MSRYLQWSRTERSATSRIGATLLAGPVFLGLLPFIVAVLGRRLNHRLGLPRLPIGRRAGSILGGVLTAGGFTLGGWSVYTQLDRGRGTPLPMMPTQELLTAGPFAYCRNPMTLGTILAYLGIAITTRTSAGIAIVFSFGGALLAYLRLVEERELAERFGEAYLAYKRRTPFIVPRLVSRS